MNNTNTYTVAILPTKPLVECYGLVMVLNAASEDEATAIVKTAWDDRDGHESEFVCVEGDQHAELIEKYNNNLRPGHADYEWPQEDLPEGVSRAFGVN